MAETAVKIIKKRKSESKVELKSGESGQNQKKNLRKRNIRKRHSSKGKGNKSNGASRNKSCGAFISPDIKDLISEDCSCRSQYGDYFVRKEKRPVLMPPDVLCSPFQIRLLFLKSIARSLPDVIVLKKEFFKNS